MLSLLFSDNMFDAMWRLALGLGLGILVGAMLGVGCFLLLRKWGGYAWDGWGGRFWRGLTGVFTVGMFILGTGCIGLCEGAWRAVRHVLHENTFMTGACTSLGKAESIFLAGVYYSAVRVRDQQGIPQGHEVAFVEKELDAFLEGRQEIRVKDLEWQLHTVGREAIHQAIGVIEIRMESLIPYLAQPGVKRYTQPMLEGVGDALVYDRARKGIRLLRLDAQLDQILIGMKEEAARAGSSESITFEQMSAYLGRWSVVGGVTWTVRSFFRQLQVLALQVMVGVLLAPVVLFWGARSLKRRQDRKRSPSARTQGVS